ncbi:MAG: epoxyqueuosine reductase [Ruminococcaceae bacterium]|nr:epoxyqueuosine reductase [Oscillospiraceae bacterium]
MKNNFKKEILSFIRSIGIPVAGFSGDGATYTNIVCLFPYYTGRKNKGTLSMYAYGKDYHVICEKYLIKISDFLRTLSPEAKTKIHVDKGDGDDKLSAYNAGLGFFGQNSLLINETYGSFVFIGYVETDLILPPDTPLTRTCTGCGRCAAACPGGAIENGKIHVEKCASAISQKRGILSAEETDILKKSGFVWGCDICQTVCPHNEKAALSPLSVFYEELLFSLPQLTMSNKTFSSSFGDRAFSWRGKAVLQRNLEILSSHDTEINGHTM